MQNVETQALQAPLCPAGWQPAKAAANANGDGGSGIYGKPETAAQVPAHSPPELRPYQVEAINKVYAEFAEGWKRVLLVAPTGAGKTVISAAIILKAVAKGKKVLFLCHRQELIDQTFRKLQAVGIDPGIIKAGIKPQPDKPVQIASIQTLHARALRSKRMPLPPADLVICDEAHRSVADTWLQAIEGYPEAFILGMTATPCRSDERGLGDIFEKLISVATIRELIEQGYLVRCRTYAPSTPDLKGVRTVGGDYATGELSRRMRALTGDVVEHWRQLAKNRPTIVFAVDVKHTKHLRDKFREAGVIAESIDGTTPKDERQTTVAAFAAGEIEVLVNCMLFVEGFDAPDASCLILARPTQSFGLYKQMVGRVMRPAPGKVDSLILDHAGMSHKFGLASEDVEWTLSQTKAAKEDSHVLTCPQCSAVRYRGEPWPCEECGYEPPKPQRHVHQQPGKLVAVEEVDRDADPRRSFLGQLFWIVNEKGYKPGWAAHKFRERAGYYPPRSWTNEDKPKPERPTAAVLNWVRWQMIAYRQSLAS